MNDIKLLAFLEVVRAGSLSKAAKQLHYSQPGISNLITSMEKEYGAKLLYRTKAGVSLTPCGEAVFPYVEKSQEYALMAIKAAREYVELARTWLFVGAVPGVARRWLPAVIKVMKDRHIPTQVIPRIDDLSEIEKALFETRTHCAFLPYTSREGLDIVELAKDPFVAVLPAGHSLAGRKSLAPQDLAGEELIRSEEVSDDEFRAIAKRMDSVPRISYTINDDITAVEMVRAGLGISLLPSLSLGDELPSGIAAVPVRGARRSIGLATLTGEYRRLTDDTFRDVCIETIRDAGR